MDHHVKVHLPSHLADQVRDESKKKEKEKKKMRESLSRNSPTTLRKVMDNMKKKKEMDQRREDFLQLQIKKNQEKRSSLLHRLHEEMGRFKLNIEGAFDMNARKLCKNNITQRTKNLIEKFQSKKHKKESDFNAMLIATARDQASAVKLDFEQEEDQKQNVIKENDNRYFQAIRKLKGKDPIEEQN